MDKLQHFAPEEKNGSNFQLNHDELPEIETNLPLKSVPQSHSKEKISLMPKTELKFN